MAEPPVMNAPPRIPGMPPPKSNAMLYVIVTGSACAFDAGRSTKAKAAKAGL